MTIFLRTDIISILLFLLVFIPETRAGAQPSGVPIGAFPNIFTYYNPSDINTPAGTDVTSKSIILLQENAADADASDGTSFLIRTFRDDDKVCICLTGHQVNDLSNGADPIVGSYLHFNADVYMNYQGGADSVVQVNGNTYHFNKRGVPFNKGYLDMGQLVGYTFGEGDDDPDIALVLVDKRALPSPSFATLGYDLTNAAWDSSTYYSIGHPHGYPQLIMDGYSVYDQGVPFLNLSRQPPGYASGPVASGSPILNRSTGPFTGSYVRGVLDGAPAGLPRPFTTDLFSTDTLDYDHNLRVTKIGQIENAIRRHCWQNRTASEILSAGLHKQSVLIDNSSGISPYTQNQSLTSATATASAAAGFTEYVNNSTETTYLKANQSNISGFTLPAIYPGSTHPWHLTVAAREINVNANFDYTASGSSELHLATVVIGSATSAVSKHLPGITDLPRQASDTASGFTVYPNPSSNGVFYISFPAASGQERYRVVVYSADGRQVYQAGGISNTRPYRLALGGQPRGAYLLGIYRQQTGEKIFSKTIIY